MFGNIDSYQDIVHKGAFVKTITEGFGRIRHLWMHDYYQPPTATIKELKEIGRTDLPGPVKEKFPEAKGGLVVVREYLETPRGNEILTGLKADPPAIMEMSFGYDPVKFDFEEIEDGEAKGTMVRNLREVRLYDISDVNWGANEATVASKRFTPFLEVYKNRLEAGRYDALARLAVIMESATLPEALMAGLTEGRVLSTGNLEKLNGALAMLEEILLAAEPPVDDEFTKALTEQVLRRLAIAERFNLTLTLP